MLILKSFSTITSFVFLIISFSSVFGQVEKRYSDETLNELKTLREKSKIAISENDSLAIARAYYKLALRFDYLGEVDSSFTYYNKALSLTQNLGNIKAIAIISNALATSYSDRGLHNKAIEIYNYAMKQFKAIKDSAALSGVLLNIGAEYIDIGQHQKGLTLSLDALKLKLQIGDSINISGYYKQIGSIFSAIGNREKWIEYTLIANSIAKKNEKYGDFYRRMDILNELGAYYFSENKIDIAQKYYDTLYVQSKKRDYNVGIVTSLANLVPILKKQKRFSEALEKSQHALQLSEKADKVYQIIKNLVEVSELEVILSQNSNAEKHLMQARDLALKFNFPNELISIYKLLSELNLKKNNYKLAYLYLIKNRELKDSINSVVTQKIIAELETKFRVTEKETQLQILNKENQIKEQTIKNQNNITFALIVFAVLIIAIIIFFYSQKQLKNKYRILDLQQNLLRTQMNPHFLFNALIAIQSYILTNKKFEAANYLTKFASLTRLILESTRQEFIPLEKEIELINNYVLIQQLRFDNSFSFNLEINPNLEPELFKIPPMILQPFIENSIEHGFKNIRDREKQLSVKYNLIDDLLEVIVEDNGLGIEKSTNTEKKEKKKKSHAIDITKERLTNIDQKYKTKIDFSIVDLSNENNKYGTRVTLKVPLKLLK